MKLNNLFIWQCFSKFQIRRFERCDLSPAVNSVGCGRKRSLYFMAAYRILFRSWNKSRKPQWGQPVYWPRPSEWEREECLLGLLLFVCLLVFVFKDDLSNVLLICLDWGTLGCLWSMIWKLYGLPLQYEISNSVRKLRNTAGWPNQCRDCSLVNSTYQAEVLATPPWHGDVRS
jgi:hypothetical protein